MGKNTMARPTIRTDAMIEEIVERLSLGEPLAQICREDGMPAARTVRDWINQHPKVSAAIAGAREDGEEWLAAECLLIADTPREGITEKYEVVKGPNPDDPELPQVEEFRITERKVEDMLGHRKLQIETRLKLLAKWNPRKYGEKVDVTGHMTLEQLVAGSASKPPPDDDAE